MLLSELAFANARPSNRFLDEMATIIPWGLFERELKQKIRHKTGGRPAYYFAIALSMAEVKR